MRRRRRASEDLRRIAPRHLRAATGAPPQDVTSGGRANLPGGRRGREPVRVAVKRGGYPCTQYSARPFSILAPDMPTFEILL